MNDSYTVNIEKLVFGGYGLAHTAEGVIFVEQAAPGDRVKVVQTGKRGGIPVGTIQSLLQESPSRRKPPCPYADVCGGCDWLHLSYKAQVEAKCAIVRECMQRIGKIENLPPIDLVESPEFEYRCRAQIKTDSQKRVLGFYKRSSNQVVQIKSCPILSPGLNNLLQNSFHILETISADCRQVRAIEGDDRTVASAPIIDGFSLPQIKKSVSGITFELDGDDFFQSNRFLLHQMGSWTNKAGKGQFFIDMYGGAGFFAAHAGPSFGSGLLVESVSALSRKAQKTFYANGLSHLEAVTLTAEAFLKKQLYKNYPHPDCLIVDPPRPGLTRIVREGIREILPKKILYVSCNPSTQARDLGFFLKKCGYHLVELTLLDLYPQTHHIETAALLSR